MFVLVKWVSGREKDTYTVVSADWVVDIDVLEFDNTKGLSAFHPVVSY